MTKIQLNVKNMEVIKPKKMNNIDEPLTPIDVEPDAADHGDGLNDRLSLNSDGRYSDGS